MSGPSFTPRLIDSRPSNRTRPMQVLVLGMCRTGTLSMYTALQKLGYNPYHMVEAVRDSARNLTLWEECLRAKYYNEGPAWGRRELDAMLGDYDAVTDVPCALLVDELVSAYPDAKVVLTLRDPEKWRVSMQGTLGHVMSWSSWPIVARLDPTFARPWWSFTNMMLKPMTKNDYSEGGPAPEGFVKHYDYVRKVVPPERLLEFEAKDGWAPLCEFLGKQQPEGSYPHINDTGNFVAVLGAMWWKAMGRGLFRMSAVVVPAAAVLWMWARRA